MSNDNNAEPILEKSGDQWITTLSSPEVTECLGKRLGSHLAGGEVIALSGELGTGKTVLVRGLATGLGIPAELITSPTFILIHEYQGRLRLIHADLYRIENLRELSSLGFHEYFQPSHTVAIEWAERMSPELPDDRLDIHLHHEQPTIRKATLTPKGPQSHNLLEKMLVKPRSEKAY